MKRNKTKKKIRNKITVSDFYSFNSKIVKKALTNISNFCIIIAK